MSNFKLGFNAMGDLYCGDAPVQVPHSGPFRSVAELKEALRKAGALDGHYFDITMTLAQAARLFDGTAV